MAKNESTDPKPDETKPGDSAQPGQAIGQAGSTGSSVGPHVHFQAPAKGTRMERRDKNGEVAETVTAYKPTTVTQLKSRGFRVAKEA